MKKIEFVNRHRIGKIGGILIRQDKIIELETLHHENRTPFA